MEAFRPSSLWQCRQLFSLNGAQRRAFTPSSRTLSAARLTAKDAASRMLDGFGDTTVVRRQLIDANQLQKLTLTLGRPILSGIDVSDVAPPDGTPLPPGYHLVYFTPNGVESDLGPDGTDMSFNAPAPFTRRMWAGGRMRWPTQRAAAAHSVQADDAWLCVGDEAEERTRLLSATPKTSRSAGEMVVVEVEKEIWSPRGLAIVDRRSWIFRPKLDPNALSQPQKSIDADVRGQSALEDFANDDGSSTRRLRWSPVALFRFSSLTFNGHKIHYNEDWTHRVEGHPGTVVHGPLNLINMLNYWGDINGKSQGPSEMVYKATSPIYAGEDYQISTLQVRPCERGKLWDVVVDKKGVTCMTGEILAE